jgi:DUF1680 family protein
MVAIITTLKQRLEQKGSMDDPPIMFYLDLFGESLYFSCSLLVAENKDRYQQAHKPIIEQERIEGHSVRAIYLLTAVADLIRIEGVTGDSCAKRSALERLWTNMVERKMYLIGGIGAQKQWEGFGIDYFLPSETDESGCYAETCAGIGVMMLAERLLQVSWIKSFATRVLTVSRQISTESTQTSWNSAFTMPF